MAITISGENNNDRILASDGVIDQLSGFNVVGVMTATSFTGDLTGDVTGNLTGNVTGNINNTTLLLQTGGTERLRIDSNGRLLLGTTTEGHVDADDFTIGTSTNSAGITIRTNTSGVGRLFFSDGTSGAAEYQGYIQYDHNNQRLSLGSGGDTRLRIDSSGRVIIGKVMTAGTGPHYDDISINNSNQSGSAGSAGIDLISNAGQYGALVFSTNSDHEQGYIKFEHNSGVNKLRFGTLGTDRWQIYSDGHLRPAVDSNYDIGSNSVRVRNIYTDNFYGTSLSYDGNKLKFGGGSRTLDNEYYDDIVIDNSDNASGASGGSGISLISGNQSWCGLIFGDSDEHQRAYVKYSNNEDYMQVTSSGYIRFDTSSNNTEALRINSNGQVLIGTTTDPAYTNRRLTVATTSGTTSIEIRSATNGDGRLYFTDNTSSGNVGAYAGKVMYDHTDNYMAFHTGGDDATPGERLRITSGGQVRIGNPNNLALWGQTNRLQVAGTDWNTSGVTIACMSNSGSANLVMGNSRASTPGGSGGALVQDSRLAYISFVGDDGTDMNTVGAAIVAELDSNASSNSMPARLRFYTGGNSSERLRITSGGHIVTGGSTPPNQAADDGSVFLKSAATLGFLSEGGSLTFNAYYNGGWKYYTTGDAHILWGSGDGINLSMAGSGTANNAVSFSRAFQVTTTKTFHFGSQTSLGKYNDGVEGCSWYEEKKSWQQGQDGGIGWSMMYFNKKSGSDNRIMHFFNNGTTCGYINRISGTNTTQFATSSDYRLKKDVVALPNGIERVKQLRPVAFKWKSNNGDMEGFLAHEAQEIVPYAVSGKKDEVATEDFGDKKKGDMIVQGVDYGEFTPLLTAALKELIAKVETLETKVAVLESS